MGGEQSARREPRAPGPRGDAPGHFNLRLQLSEGGRYSQFRRHLHCTRLQLFALGIDPTRLQGGKELPEVLAVDAPHPITCSPR